MYIYLHVAGYSFHSYFDLRGPQMCYNDLPMEEQKATAVGRQTSCCSSEEMDYRKYRLVFTQE